MLTDAVELLRVETDETETGIEVEGSFDVLVTVGKGTSTIEVPAINVEATLPTTPVRELSKPRYPFNEHRRVVLSYVAARHCEL